MSSLSPVMTTKVENDTVQCLFDKLEAQKNILSSCTEHYEALISLITSTEQSLASKYETLNSKLQFLDSTYEKSLEELQCREDSIPDRFASLSSIIESHKQAALEEFQKEALSEDAPMSDALRSVCRKMDHSGLLKLTVARRKESVALRAEMGTALADCVDPPRLLLDTVKEFLDMKAAGKGGMTDKRRACATVVAGMFPPDELKEKKGGARPEFSKAMVDRAEAVVREWIEVADKIAAGGSGRGGGCGGSCVGDGDEGLSGMGPAEASMFLQIVLGFGLKEKFEEDFYRKLVVEFAARRDMPKLAIPIFGDKIGDIIDELVKKGKQVEAVYFATDTGLTERFKPASLLKASLQTYKNNVTDILKKGNRTQAAIDEANTYEVNFIKFITKCVEDLNMESEFSLESLRKRLAVLEKAKADKKKGTTAGTKPSNKRGHSSGVTRSSAPPPLHPAKMTKFSNPYPPVGQRNPISPTPNPVSRYPAPYNYPSYNAGATSLSYGPSYGGSQHVPPSAQITQQHYGVPGDSVGGVGARLGGSYGSQPGYGSYDYSAAAPPTYKPSSYA